MFPNQPPLAQYLDDPSIKTNNRNAVGDIRQPWIDLSSKIGINPFDAKALFALGMMRRYILSVNALLKDLRHLGFLSACGLIGSCVELLGRCIHPDKQIRQDPVSGSKKRLEEGFQFVRRPYLPVGVVVETNHYTKASGGYNVIDLINLRNLASHGGCLSKASQIKGDIELLHELRKAIYGVPIGEIDPHEGEGPIKGALDNYFGLLSSGDNEICDRLASAGISPVPLSLQKGAWPFDARIINDTKQHIHGNLTLARLPISGGHTKERDFFQLYP